MQHLMCTVYLGMLVLWLSADFIEVDDHNQLVDCLKMVVVVLKCLLSLVAHHLAVWPHLRHNVHLATMLLMANRYLDLLYHL